MNLKERLENLILNKPEDITMLDSLLDEVRAEGYPVELQRSLLCVLEQNPKFHFGMPGNLVRAIEKHYKATDYEDLIVESIERIPTEYNLWLLNRLLNSYESDEKKERGITLFQKITQNTTDELIKDIVQDFLSDYED